MVKSQLKDLISQGNTQEVIQQLKLIAKQTDDKYFQEEVLLQSARYEQYATANRQGTSHPEEQKITIAKINKALLYIIDKVPNDLQAPATTKTTETKEDTAPPPKTKKSLWKKWAAIISGGIVFLAAVAELSGYSLRDLFSSPTPEAGNTVTVLVHGEEGKDQLVLPSRGIVKLIYGDAIISEQINNKGKATFNQVPERFFSKGKKVEILFQDPEDEPYRAIHHDSSYQLEKGQYIALPVKLFGLGQIRGIVKDFETGDLIEGVRVSIQGEEVFSNQYGEYLLKIPPAKQQKFQTIRAFKEGYETFELSNVPIQTDREIPISMKPKKVKKNNSLTSKVQESEMLKKKILELEKEYKAGKIDISRYLDLKSGYEAELDLIQESQNK